VVALVLVCMLIFGFWNRQKLPRYEGRTVVEWLEQVNADSMRDRAKAMEAIRSLGPKAMPTLRKYLLTKDSWLKEKLIALSGKQSFIDFSLTSPMDRRRMARKAYAALGSVAVQHLMEFLEDPDLYYANGNPAYEASFVLSDIGADAVPALVQALTNSSPAVRYHSCFCLGAYERLRSSSAVSPLADRMGDTEWTVRCQAAVALGRIKLEPDIGTAALARGLRDPESGVRYSSARALAAYGQQSVGVISELRSALARERYLPENASEPWLVGSKSHDDVVAAIDKALSAMKAETSEVHHTAEPDGPANRSQPIRSETNRTSSADGL